MSSSVQAARKQNERERRLTELLGTGQVQGVALARRITQKSFEDAVDENMSTFGSSKEQAKQDVLSELCMQKIETEHLSLEF